MAQRSGRSYSPEAIALLAAGLGRPVDEAYIAWQHASEREVEAFVADINAQSDVRAYIAKHIGDLA